MHEVMIEEGPNWENYIFNRELFEPERQRAPFMLLGNYREFGSLNREDISEDIAARILKRDDGKDDELPFWGTLGLDNNYYGRSEKRDFGFGGIISFSNVGSTESDELNSGAETIREIGYFRKGQFRDEEANREFKNVRERCISLEEVDFNLDEKFWSRLYGAWHHLMNKRDLTEDDIEGLLKLVPMIRLTLYLKKDEAATVFYQYGNDLAEMDDVFYIMPEPTAPKSTDEEETFNCTSRNRLTYKIPVIPFEAFYTEDIDLNLSDIYRNIKLPNIKILTGERAFPVNDAKSVGAAANSTVLPNSLLKQASKKLLDREGLKVWDKQKYKFRKAKAGELESLNGKKLLFLIHGTFSSTKGAFKELINRGDKSWIAKNTSKYDGVIAFNHHTVTEGLKDNTDVLINALPDNFRADVDIIAHSRGVLLGKYISHYIGEFTVHKGVMVGGANGVGYLKALRGFAYQSKGVNILLNVLKNMVAPGSSHATIISSAAQYSARWLANQPGFKAMTPGHPDLNEVLIPTANRDNEDAQRHDVEPEYFRAVGDYRLRWGRYRYSPFKLTANLFLGRRNDWVVGSIEQSDVRPGKDGHDTNFDRPHIKYFSDKGVKNFLSGSLP